MYIIFFLSNKHHRYLQRVSEFMLKVTRAYVCIYVICIMYIVLIHDHTILQYNYILLAVNCGVVFTFLIYKPPICNILHVLVVSEKPHYIKLRVYNESKISTKSEFIISTYVLHWSSWKKMQNQDIKSAKWILASDVCLIRA